MLSETTDPKCQMPWSKDRASVGKNLSSLSIQSQSSYFFLNIRKKCMKAQKVWWLWKSELQQLTTMFNYITCYKPCAGLRFLNAVSYFQKASIILWGGVVYNPQVFSNSSPITSGKAWDFNLWVSICPQILTLYLNQ